LICHLGIMTIEW